jgi:Peptidase family M23
MNIRHKILAVWFAALIIGAGAELTRWVRSSAQTRSSLPYKLGFQPSSTQVISFAGGDSNHVSFEIFVSNYEKTPIKFRAVRIKGVRGTQEVYSKSFENDSLSALFSSIAGDYLTPQSPVLQPGASGILFFFLDFASRDSVPETLTAAMEVEGVGTGNTPQTFTVEPVRVLTDAALSVSPPLRGSGWLAANGPSNNTPHRRAVIVLNGRPYIPERFAIDWVRMGKDGTTFAGDPGKNESYLAYNSEILAAADGQVMAVLDGIPDNVPQQPPAVTITLENIAGNHIVQNLGDGRYALYAHLIPGSLLVKPGDRVRRGQVIGRLGNSGNSTEPHLHFQVMNGPQPLASDGLPFLLAAWTRQEYKVICPSPKCELTGKPVKIEFGATRKVIKEIALEDQLGDFGNP